MHKRAVNTTGPVDSRAGTTCFLAGHDCASEALKGGGKKKKKREWTQWRLAVFTLSETQNLCTGKIIMMNLFFILLFPLSVYSRRVKVLIGEDRPI